MAISPLALKAYTSALNTARDLDQDKSGRSQEAGAQGFTETLGKSLRQVNNLSLQKASMIEDIATGKSENVHELMITLQKSGIAMSMTTAVRNKVLEAYRELMRMPF